MRLHFTYTSLKAIVPLGIFFAMLAVPRVSFSQSRVSADMATEVKAGENVDITVTLDQAPNIEGVCLRYAFAYLQACMPLFPRQTEYHLSLTIPATAPGGTYSFGAYELWDGIKSQPIKPVRIEFRVRAHDDIVLPTAVSARINPSQSQLLRTEAINLQSQIQQLKADLISLETNGSSAQVKNLLVSNIAGAELQVERTEAKFLRLEANHQLEGFSNVFFGDIKLSYDLALKSLNEKASGLKPVSVRDGQSRSTSREKSIGEPYPAIALGTLRALEQNELSYHLVAFRESLLFDLTVNSNPVGAGVRYHLRGDSPKQNPDPTNTTIKNLTFAIWLVRVEKPGYRPQEREHDPSREPNHIMTFELEPGGD